MGCSEGKLLSIDRARPSKDKDMFDINKIIINDTNKIKQKSSQITNSSYEFPVSNGLKDLIIKDPIKSPRRSLRTSMTLNNNTSIFSIYPMSLVDERSNTFSQDYEIKEIIGKGAFGVVYKIKHKKTQMIRALKIVKKENLNFQDDEQLFLKEIEILSGLDHPNIMKIYEYFFDGDNYYIISEFIEGGELLDQLHKITDYCEHSAAVIMTQLFSAIYYLHSNNIVHRDIKPENIMLQIDKDNDLFIKLIDFGTANFSVKDKFTVQYGSAYYLAPEVLKQNYTSKCDIWSCGVILYLMVSGKPPFPGKDNFEILTNVEKGKYNFNNPCWEDISDEGKDFITQLLTYDPTRRPTAEICLKHEWISQNSKLVNRNIDLSSFLKNLHYFNSQNKLQQSIVAYIIHHISSSEMTNKLRNIFRYRGERNMKV